MKNINYLILKNKISVSISTPVKIMKLYKDILEKSFYKKEPELISSDECPHCKKYRNDINDNSVLCRKHYALDLLKNDKQLTLMSFIYDDKKIYIFGRYGFFNIPDSNNYTLVYAPPFYISKNKLLVYVVPKSSIDISSLKVIDFDRSIVDDGLLSYDIGNRRFWLDVSSPLNVREYDYKNYEC